MFHILILILFVIFITYLLTFYEHQIHNFRKYAHEYEDFFEDDLLTVCYNSEIKVKRKISLMCGSTLQNNQIVQTIKIYIDSIVVFILSSMLLLKM